MTTATKLFTRLAIVLFVASFAAMTAFAQEMTKEDWQKQVADLTTKRNDLKNKLTAAQTEVSTLKQQDAEKAAALQMCQDEVAQMMKNNAADEAAYNASLTGIDDRLNELSRLSNQDLYARRAELDSLQAMIDQVRKDPNSAVEKNATRINDQQARLDALRKSLTAALETGTAMQTYTVGTWAKDRDCLWNIAKKPKIYDNAFLWPKIWQGNRDQIKNPDIIEPGQKLKIPPKADLTAEENSAVKKYWSKKRAAAAPAPTK